jgi:hypothetical protein
MFCKITLSNKLDLFWTTSLFSTALLNNCASVTASHFSPSLVFVDRLEPTLAAPLKGTRSMGRLEPCLKILDLGRNRWQ